MVVELKADPGGPIVRIVLSGEIAVRELAASVEEIVERDDLPTPLRLLYDCRKIERLKLDPRGIRDLVDLARQRSRFDGARVAAVATDDLVYGMARMTSTLTEIAAAGFVYEAYRDIAEAEAWLLSP